MLSLRLPAAAVIVAALLLVAANARAQNTVQLENAKPGTPNWQLTNPATNHEIEGYASLISVNRGGQISFFVNTADPTFTLEIFRMGWYGGDGARLMAAGVQLAGTVQPIPTPDPTTGLVECQWSNPYTIAIPNDADDPTDWASGVYLVRLTGNASGKQSYIFFIVRDDARASTYLFQASTNTFEAYNNWGGKSLYAWNSTNEVAAINVSYNRPFALGNQPISAAGVGAGEFLTNFQLRSETPAVGWCYPMVRFLEREGYDVAYISDVDAHENGALLLSHKGLLVVGHSEYWSWQMRSNVQAARDARVNLAFFSSNTCYWQIRFAPSAITGAADRTIICYKSATTDPYASNPNTAYLTTTEWRLPPLNMPEEALVGVMYSTDPVNADIIVSDSSHWVYTYTGLHNGDHLPGMLGYEVDSMHGNQPADTVGVAHETTASGVSADTTVYTAASGATVFASGSFDWSWGLDDFGAPNIRTSSINPAGQQITRNILSKLAGQTFAPAFSIIPNPRLLTVGWGSSVNFTVTTTSFGYTPTLTLSLSGLPANVPYTFSPATISGSGTSTLAISPTSASPTGTYVLTIRANDGAQTRTEAVTLNILESLVSIDVAPGNSTITTGGTQQFVAIGNYQGGSTQNITSQVSWTSSNTLAATINSAGLASGLATGVATIKASLSGISGSTSLTVATPAAIRYVQSASGVSSKTSSGISTSFASSTTAGNAIVVAVSAAGSAITSVADTQGNSYKQAVVSGGTAIWYAANIRGSADTITAQFASSSGFSLIYVHEYAGLDPSSPLDQVSTSTSVQIGNGTAITSGNVTTTQANELIFGYASVDNNVSAGGAGFTVRQTAGGNMSEDMIVSAAGTYAATFTQNFSGGWTATIATFKAAPIGPPTLQSIAVTPANPTISVGSSPLQMTATGTYSDSSTQNITGSCTWTSSATGVATVNSSGQVTPVAAGSTSIKCTDGSVSGSTTVTVTTMVPAIHYVQSANAVSGQTASKISVSFASSVTVGNAIIVAIAAVGPAISSVADTQGNTYVQAVASGSDAIWYAVNVKGGADTVTANFATSTGYSLIYVHEYAGLAANPLDQVSTQTGTGTAVTSGAKTTTQANELIFGYASVDNNVSAGGAGFTVRQTAGGNMSEDMIVSAAGTYAATFTQSKSGGWAGLMATFKAVASGPPPTLQSIAVTPANPTISVGSSPLQMTATGTYSDSSTQNITGSCTWTSSATGVATVNSSGQVTPVAAGSTSIKCTDGSVSGSTTVTVTTMVPAIHYVQSANAVSGQTASKISVSFASSVTVGNAIIVAIAAVGPAISSVADTQGNTYVQAVASGSDAIWYAVNVKGGADTVTANFATSTGYSLIYVHEYAGLAANPLDQVSTQTGTGTAVTSGAKTTTQANELIFGYASVDNNVSAGGAGFTVRQTAGGNMSEDMIVSAAGTYAATFTQSKSGGWAGLMAAFEGSTGAGGGDTPPTAVIGASPTSGAAALTVAFTGTGSSDPDGTISSYAWDFGDGQTSTLGSPSHTYTVAGTYAVVLTVTDNAGKTGTATTTINLNAPASYAGVYRIIAGGGPYTDTQGQVWQADAGFNTGNVTTTTATISGTSDPALYQSERWYDPGQTQLEYQLPVANGTYLVNLYFAETDAASQGSGLRVFDVDFQGSAVIGSLDIFGTVGANAALVKSVVVSVTTGTLSIDFVRVVGNPKIDAIEVREVSAHDAALPKSSWDVISVDSEESDTLDGSSLNAIDNNAGSFWMTQISNNGGGNAPSYPHDIQIDLGKSYPLSGLQYLPRQDGSTAGRIAQYNFFVSSDGVNWGSAVVSSGTFASTALQKQVSFTPVNARYVQLQPLSEVNGNIWASMAELNVLFACAVTPSVTLTAPVDEYLQSSGASLAATARACLDPVQNAGWGVRFMLDGSSPIDVHTAPFRASYAGLSKAEHVIDAYVINSAGTVVSGTGTHDQVKSIGIGDYYVTIGDSVTWGQNGAETTSSDGRDVSSGYQPTLNNQLTGFKNYPQEVSDQGVPGTTSAEGLKLLPAVLQKHPTSQTFLMMYGMNDARPWLPVPSGEGLNPGDSGYAGSYKANMQQIINTLKGAGKTVDLAKINVALADCADNVPTDPGYCTPYPNINTGARNVLIQQYNTVVDELVSNAANGITVTPPDFYNYFLGTYHTQYSDNIHPNTTGYQSMANLWFQALTQ